MEHMKERNLLIKALILAFFIFLANQTAMSLDLYYIVWWFDMPMHFFGGFFLSLLCFYIFSKYYATFVSFSFAKQAYAVIFSTLLLGIAWEIFETALDIFITSNKQILLDTTSDIFFDLAGALAGLLYLKRKSI